MGAPELRRARGVKAIDAWALAAAMRTLLLIALLAAPLLAGCATQGPPEQRAQVALAQFAAELGPGGGVRELEGTMVGQGMNGAVRVEYGKHDATLIEASMPGYGSVVFYCDAARRIVSIAGIASETRPRACFQMGDAVLDPSALLSSANMTPTSVTANMTRVRAVYAAPMGSFADEDDVGAIPALVVESNWRSRVDHLEMTGGGFTLVLDVEYGPRRSIAVPPGAVRAAASIEEDIDFYDGVFRWSVDDTRGDGVSLGEFEARIVPYDAGPNATPLARFALREGEQFASGFNFTFRDDGDGNLSEGDAIEITGPGWTTRTSYQLLVWDTWANAAVADSRVVPAAGWVAIAAFGIVVLLRRAAE